MAKKKRAKDVKVKVDRRKSDRRAAGERRKKQETVTIERRKSTRRKIPRRRQIDPTTCERDYSNDEIEFMHALDVYKRANGRMFPTCSEILEVVRKLGYVRISDGVIATNEENTPMSVESSDVEPVARLEA